ncbi:SigE family RNA polymerase sigma factor [Jatrophihabitans endophyticus]|uniref:SigE family RNA polymerase sigma factor n=1 Tax=Jatrophihabitans endophyticus TaxID=1206085 RepID=UPI0026F031F7|nr:SigE family RNA polymerase sigma factor [Jatrophihabitans endophyticus]
MRDEEFESFVRRSRRPMVRTATALTVGDPHLAEDVVQRALVKLYLAWPRVRTMNVDAYARRVLVTTFVDERRRPFFRRESVVRDVPDRPDGAARGDFDPELVAALRTLPRGMRSIVILRYVENLTVEETAELVGCSTGNVKSQAARGLAKLRSELGLPEPRRADAAPPATNPSPTTP